MKIALVSFSVISCVCSLSAVDLSPGGGKSLAEPVEFKTSEEYDAEAEIRINSFSLPEGVEASLFADPAQTQNPSAICFDDQGRLYVAEIHRWRSGVQDIRNEQQILLDDINNETSQDRLEMYQRDALTRPVSFYSEFEDRIVRIEDTNGNGRANSSQIWADGFNDPLDGPGIGLVAGRDNDIYYTNIPHLWKLRDTNNDGTADKRASLQDGFGVRMSISGHDMHGIVWGPDGKLYWSIGDRGYDLNTKEGRYIHRNYEGGVFRCDPDGSNLEEVYRGLRNPQELAFDKYGNLFTCDNDADAWDKGRLVYILEGGNSGWHHGHQVILNFRNQLELRTPDYDHPDRKTVPMSPWLTEGIWETHHKERPAFALPPVDIVSWGPSGLVYNYGVTTMPERYDDHFWICNFGGAKGDLEAFTVKQDGAGFALDQHEIFMVGLGNTDVEFGPDGRMYLSCFNNNGWYKQDIGNIYALSSPEPHRPKLLEQTGKLLTTDFAPLVESEVAPLLAHPDMRVRLRAQFDLVRRQSRPVLAKALQSKNQLERLHGLWGLGQLARKDDSIYKIHIDLLTDDDAEVRAQAAKVLSDSCLTSSGEALLEALSDESPRVQAFAAIGVGKCQIPTALPALIDLLATNDNSDVYLRHACTQGLWGLNEREKMLKQLHHESAAVRLGILLTLRKLEDPRVKYLLNDPDVFVRTEAVRAINDLNLITALPDLAALIQPYAYEDASALLPEDHRDWLTHCRIINANFRVGTPENAAALLGYAANINLPEILREQALLALLEWKSPTPVDPTNGFYRPLDPGSRSDISVAVAEGLPTVFENSSGSLLSLATRLALDYNVEAPVELLTRQILDEEADLDARIGSLIGLARQDSEVLLTIADDLLTSKNTDIRASIVEQLVKVAPERGQQEALALANSNELKLRQSGYRSLAILNNQASRDLFASRLSALGEEPVGSLLDLLESAELAKEDDRIAKLLANYTSGLDPADPTAAFKPALAGGDKTAGKEIFMTHAVGQCAKCHKVDGDGGIAGPDLTGIGTRQSTEYLLQSLVDPSAVVVPGYGLTMMTLKNGESVGGAFVSESDSEIILKIPDPENSAEQIEQRIAKAEVATRQPAVSAMPPMGYAMSKTEIRDLVAYLASLREKKAKKGH